jgi:hypothetical protein
MDSLYLPISRNESDPQVSRAISTEQLLLLALPFVLPKTGRRISRRQDQYHCVSTKLFACAASTLQ